VRALRIPASNSQNYNDTIDNFKGGTNTLINEARLGKNTDNKKYARESTNIVQVQDGIWETRPGLSAYGNSLGATPDGATEFVKENGDREIIAIAGGKIWKSTNNGVTWTEVTGATFTPGHRPFFLQYKNQLVISNRHDALALYNGSTATPYNALSNPSSAPTLTRAVLTAGSHTYYVRYTANNAIGWTQPSPALTVTVNKPRESWDRDAGEYCTYTLPTVTGALSYDVWLGTTSGEEFYLGSTDAGNLVFRDTGAPVNPYREAPDDNSTAAPKFGPMEMSGNRLWATYDPDQPWRVYASGTSQYLGYFSPFYGGAWIDLESGGRLRPVGLAHYRTGKGDPTMTIFCQSPDGLGTIFQVELQSMTVENTTFIVPIAYKLVGSIGSDAAASVTKIGDNVGITNKKGAYFLRNKEQMFNVLSTDDMTAPIRNKWQSLNQNRMIEACGHYSPPRWYISVPNGASNDTTVIYDTERKNWTWGWNVGFKQFLEYTDTAGKTKLLGVPNSGDQLVEISENNEGDFGSAFYQCYLSPLIPIDPDDHRVRAKIRDVIFELGELRGSAVVEVLGKTSKTDISTLATDTVPGTTGNSGWSDDFFSSMFFSDTDDVPTTFTTSTRKKRVRVNKKLYAIQYKVWSNTISHFQLLSIQATGFVLPGRPPSAWN
jgi:hypothetical protein